MWPLRHVPHPGGLGGRGGLWARSPECLETLRPSLEIARWRAGARACVRRRPSAKAIPTDADTRVLSLGGDANGLKPRPLAQGRA